MQIAAAVIGPGKLEVGGKLAAEAVTRAAEKLAADFTATGAIGETGRIGEEALKHLGGDGSKFFRTNLGARFVDQLASGIANESKVGYTSLNALSRSQIAKDIALKESG